MKRAILLLATLVSGIVDIVIGALLFLFVVVGALAVFVYVIRIIQLLTEKLF